MTDNKDGGAPNSSNKKKESKLDTWLRQTLQGGSKPKTQQGSSTSKKAPKKGTKSASTHNKKPNNSSSHKPQGASKTHGNNKPQTSRPPSRKNKNFRSGKRFKKQPFNKGPQNSPAKFSGKSRGNFKGKLRCIPIGGLNEVGKNCMVLEYEEDIIIIDMGYQFPEADFLGVDYIIPDLSYLKGKEKNIRGIIFTHGHLDHIGAASYLIPQLGFPEMYGAQLTMSLVQKQLTEFGLVNQSKINIISSKDTLQLGPFNISFFGVNHSIPDSLGVIVKTPAGNIVHTGDFKFDLTPSGHQKPAEFDKISALAHQDMAALFIDSTNALKPGHTITEQKIGDSLEEIVKNTNGRIIIASFSSQIGRLQQIVNAAVKYDRKIILSGRSLIDNFAIAGKIGYLRVPQGLTTDIYRAKKIPPEKSIVLTTGSQGEDFAALNRMAREDHSKIKIKKGDTIVLSSSPIPGNEKAVTGMVNKLSRLGANIINNNIMDVHTSGHAAQEDLKLMMTMVKPRNVVPIHGEYFMRKGCKALATSLGYSDSQGIIIENGDVLEIENNDAVFKGEKVENKYIMVDGLGVGDISEQVITDRQTLAENGVLVLMIEVDKKSRKPKGKVEVISRGFIYMKESDELVKTIGEKAHEHYLKLIKKRPDANRNEAKKYLRESLDSFVQQKIDRSPLILPVIIEK